MSVLVQRFGRFTMLIVLGAVFGWLGPYGTFSSLDLPHRMAFWILGVLFIGFPAGLLIRGVAQTAPSASWPAPVQAAIAALINGVPGTFIVIALQAMFIRAPAITVPTLLQLYSSVTVLTAVIAIPWTMIRMAQKRAASTSAPPRPLPAGPNAGAADGVARSRFLGRISAKLGTELLYVATEDHYLRIVTDRGSNLILFRFSDALSELSDVPGQQVHRSYWVAERAVAATEQVGQRTFLVLTNGEKVPVSQTFLPAIRRAGWLARHAGGRNGELPHDPLAAKS